MSIRHGTSPHLTLNMGAGLSSVLLLTATTFWVQSTSAELVCCCLERSRHVWEETTLNSGQGPGRLAGELGSISHPAIPLGDHDALSIAEGSQRRLRRGPDVRSFRHLGWRLQLSQRKRERPNMVEGWLSSPFSSCIHLVKRPVNPSLPNPSSRTNKGRRQRGAGGQQTCSST